MGTREELAELATLCAREGVDRSSTRRTRCRTRAAFERLLEPDLFGKVAPAIG